MLPMTTSNPGPNGADLKTYTIEHGGGWYRPDIVPEDVNYVGLYKFSTPGPAIQ
jgi:hypothetical protein